MPFDASKPDIVQLDYDFRPYVNASGRTPEPTDDMVAELQTGIQEAVNSLRGRNTKNSAKAVEELKTLSKEERKEISAKMFAAIAKATQGRPSFEQMMELNSQAYRLGQAYMGSFLGDVLDPKEDTTDTND